MLDSLLKITANFYVATEWTPMNAEQARKEVNSAAIGCGQWSWVE